MNSRNKGLVFHGPAHSGKTKKAHEIASLYAKDEVLYIKAHKPFDKLISDPWLFSDMTSSTKLVIFDDITPDFELEHFFGLLTGCDAIVSNKQYAKKQCFLLPDLIITCDDRYILPTGRSYTARFDFIEFPTTSDIQFTPIYPSGTR